jgi:DNA-binding winged helix-turn-helix (wHTH) protein
VIPLSPRAIDLLLLMIDQPGVLFTKDEIFDKLWPDVTVTDNALTQVISELRQAMGDKPNAPVYIETVPRRGYRWMSPVENLDPAPAAVTNERGVDLQAPLTHAAQLQSAIVTALMAGLKVTITAAPAHAQSHSTRETSSLAAYRLATDGRLKLETLEPSAIQSAVADFAKAIALDPAYAPAHIGLAHAHFWLYQATRMRSRPVKSELDAAIAHAERAVALDPGLAEAHAALALFLSITNRVDDARAHGRLAVSMEPGNWRHQFQLGIAAWGGERLACLAQVMTQYPSLTHAHFGAAQVHIARGDLDAADSVLAAGLDEQRKTPSDRLPGRGLHWLRGLIAFSRDRVDDARTHLDAELSHDGQDLFADEFVVDALGALGFSRLATNEPALAAECFERALARVPDHARSWMALSEARRKLGDERGAEDARRRGVQGQKDLEAFGRHPEAAMAGAMAFFLDGDVNDACAALTKYLADQPLNMAASTLPIEPWIRPFAEDKRVKAVLKQLADRAT